MKSGNACDGWRKHQMKSATAKYIVQNDRPFAESVLGHNQHGANVGCWEATK